MMHDGFSLGKALEGRVSCWVCFPELQLQRMLVGRQIWGHEGGAAPGA